MIFSLLLGICLFFLAILLVFVLCILTFVKIQVHRSSSSSLCVHVCKRACLCGVCVCLCEWIMETWIYSVVRAGYAVSVRLLSSRLMPEPGVQRTGRGEENMFVKQENKVEPQKAWAGAYMDRLKPVPFLIVSDFDVDVLHKLRAFVMELNVHPGILVGKAKRIQGETEPMQPDHCLRPMKWTNRSATTWGDTEWLLLHCWPQICLQESYTPKGILGNVAQPRQID